jgi:hypothetical protein
MMDTLVDLLVERGIRLKSYRPGHTEQVRCPKWMAAAHARLGPVSN